jgi:hypothetical protein
MMQKFSFSFEGQDVQKMEEPTPNTEDPTKERRTYLKDKINNPHA